MLCPICNDKVENGKCTFCGYVLTAEELKKGALSAPSSTINVSKSSETYLNECKDHNEHKINAGINFDEHKLNAGNNFDEHKLNTGNSFDERKLNSCDDHDDHNINNTQYKQTAEGTYTHKAAETIDLLTGKTVATGSGSYSSSTNNTNTTASSEEVYSSILQDRNNRKFYTMAILFSIIFPIVGIIISVLGMNQAPNEEEKKKFKTPLIIAAVLLGLNFMGTIFFPLLMLILGGF